MRRRLTLIGVLIRSVLVVLAMTPLVQGKTAAPLPDTVNFASADGHTALVAYVFHPPGNDRKTLARF